MRGRISAHVHKEVLLKTNPKNQKEQRTKNEHEKKSRYFLGGIQCRQYLLGGIQYRRYPVLAVPFGRYRELAVLFWRYRELTALFGGIFLAGAVKPEYGGIFSAVMQYGGNLVAVGGFSFFGGNDFGGRRYYQNMAVNRHITGTAHQGGNFTAGKIPTTTLQISGQSRT